MKFGGRPARRSRWPSSTSRPPAEERSGQRDVHSAQVLQVLLGSNRSARFYKFCERSASSQGLRRLRKNLEEPQQNPVEPC